MVRVQWTRWLALGSVVLAVAVHGCRRQETPLGCQFNSECAAGQICKEHNCVTGCESDRDCETNFHCINGACDFPVGDAGPVRDAGRRDSGAGVSSSSSSSSGGTDGGTVEEEQQCGNGVACAAGLVCTNVTTAAPPVCLSTCVSLDDGGVAMSNCSTGRKCYPTDTAGVGVCIRTAGRDEDCFQFYQDDAGFHGRVDPLLLCDVGLQALVANPGPSACACKLLCPYVDCPGPNCPCPSTETCVHGIVGGNALGACGTEIPPGDVCADPFGYPFTSSEYCGPAMNVPPALAPFPYCYFESFVTFTATCQLICAEPTSTTQLACPFPQLCLEADMDIWGPGYRTCQNFSVPNDGGMVTLPDASVPPDAGDSSASSSAASSAAASSSSVASSSSSAASTGGASSAASSSVAASSSSAAASSSGAVSSQAVSSSSSAVSAAASSAAASSASSSSSGASS